VTGSPKARLSWDKALVAGFLAGAYIAIGGLLAVTVSAGMRPEIRGTLSTFCTGTVFALGLILVIPDITWWDAVHNWIFALLGNPVGAVILVAGAYWFLYARQVQEEPGDTPSGAPERGAGRTVAAPTAEGRR
jgi:formate/nitrite transporter FocA (FNT family)